MFEPLELPQKLSVPKITSVLKKPSFKKLELYECPIEKEVSQNDEDEKSEEFKIRRAIKQKSTW